MRVRCGQFDRFPRRGALAVEAALCVPILFGFLMWVVELGRLMEGGRILTSAARDAGRRVAAGEADPAKARDLVADALTRAGISPRNMAATVSVVGRPAGSTLRRGDLVEVVVTIPVRDVRWVPDFPTYTYAEAMTARTAWRYIGVE